MGEKLVFLVDGLGADVLSAYASVAPSLSAMAAAWKRSDDILSIDNSDKSWQR